VHDNEAVLFLTKLLPIFVYPLGLAIVLLLFSRLAIILDWRRAGVLSASGALALLWVCSTPVFAEWAMASLERQYPATAISDTPEADVAIILGGTLGQAVPPRVSPDLGSASDRVLHAARLYRAGKVKRILVAAGNIPWLPALKPEAQLIRELLVEWGVPEANIELGGASRNTYENALEISAMRETSGFASALLVTSAAHMPRAIAVFRRAGLPVMPSTTDVEVIDGRALDLLVWLPDVNALAMTTAAVKEWIGLWTYRARGYL
jgi:uncharacterized SAM-binding protein YcdF (DUF218 family)